MKARQFFYLSVGVVTLLMAVMGAASLFVLRETVIVMTFDGRTPRETDVARTQEILEQRIKAFGDLFDVRSGKVERCAEGFTVRLRGHKDFSDFSEVLLRHDQTRLYLAAAAAVHEAFEKSGTVPEGFSKFTILHERVRPGTWAETRKANEGVLLHERPEMVFSDVKAVHFAREGWFRRCVITIEFDDDQTKQFARLTSKHKGERLALCIEGEVFSAPVIHDEISNGIVQIRNIIYAKKAKRLYDLLRIGALPAPLKVLRITPPATRGEASIEVAGDNAAGK
ncbi:MAG: hypothetical protein HQ592_04825 [Planctomycetes bacterium]|nr:hypothetical protein [Planctomycetota bacterium]